jgi:phosphatidylserine/phosphatidylglycerophosphate/cardiolipin synthase-like enzyme
LTRQVLVNLVRSAKTSLILVSFAAYRVAELADEIGVAAQRDVDVRLVLEDSEADGGSLRFAATKAFSELGSAVNFYHWPPADRPVNSSGGRASMHVKSALADEHTCLVTSANLTGQAVDVNMELGLLVRGGPVPARLSRHFRQLMVDGVLKPVPQ